MEEVAKYESNGVAKKEEEASPENKRFMAMQQHNRYLYKAPAPEWVKENKYANNAKYLPIRVVEDLLRSVFGVYQVEMIGQPQIMGNCVVVSVHLKVYHPILSEWLSYAGTGAVPIELNSKTSRNALDFENINPKALHKNVPSALSFAVSNAAKKIGRIFGSDLNSQETTQKRKVYGNV